MCGCIFKCSDVMVSYEQFHINKTKTSVLYNKCEASKHKTKKIRSLRC